MWIDEHDWFFVRFWCETVIALCGFLCKYSRKVYATIVTTNCKFLLLYSTYAIVKAIFMQIYICFKHVVAVTSKQISTCATIWHVMRSKQWNHMESCLHTRPWSWQFNKVQTTGNWTEFDVHHMGISMLSLNCLSYVHRSMTWQDKGKQDHHNFKCVLRFLCSWILRQLCRKFLPG